MDDLRKQADVHHDSRERERWLPIPGHEGVYEVSDLGKVRSLPRYRRSRNGGQQRVAGRVLKPFFNRGYPTVNLSNGKRGDSSPRGVHILILEAFVGPRPEGMEACHNDGHPENCTLTNLRWDSKAANAQDRIRHGRDHGIMRTACSYSHELFPPNLVDGPLRRGHRACKACHRARANEQTARHRGELSFDFKSVADGHYERIMSGKLALREITHCPQNHPYSGENLIIRPRGNTTIKVCRECQRDASRRSRARRAQRKA